MRHFTPEELVDLAEHAGPSPAAPHLDACERCRRQLADARAMLAAASAVDVPEPSPLFWNHFSERVRQAIATGKVSQPSPWSLGRVWTRFAWPLSAGAAAVVLVAAMLGTRLMAPGAPDPSRLRAFMGAPPPPPPLAMGGVTNTSTSVVGRGPEDPSLRLVSDLVSVLEPGAAADVATASRLEVNDGVVSQLSDDERIELQRLLKEALARQGA